MFRGSGSIWPDGIPFKDIGIHGGGLQRYTKGSWCVEFAGIQGPSLAVPEFRTTDYSIWGYFRGPNIFQNYPCARGFAFTGLKVDSWE